jgi:hypothetical protein
MVRKGVVVATLAFLCVPTLAPAAQTQSQTHKKRAPHATSAPVVTSIGSFTPAAADARFGASFGRGGLSASGFRFTPSQTQGGSRRVTVAVRTRAGTP